MDGDLLASLPIRARPDCVRCLKSIQDVVHRGWDDRGPICEDCWEKEVEAIEKIRHEREWAEHERDLRDCGV